MSKGAETRDRIVERAFLLAARDGLEGLSIGALAENLGMSKSGLFAHFGSKEDLQVEVLKWSAERFRSEVGAQALKAPRGLPRLRKLFSLWLAWANDGERPGGCLFIPASTELDDREGRPRDYLVATMRELLDFIAGAARLCVEQRHLRADLDCEQFAHEVYGIILATHHARRLLRDPKAEARATKSLERLIAANLPLL